MLKNSCEQNEHIALVGYILHSHQNSLFSNIPDSKVHGANMGPIWGRQDPGGPHVDPINFAIWDVPLR